MAPDPIVFLCSNPVPETWSWDAKEAGAAIGPPTRVAPTIIGAGYRPVGAISVSGPHFRVHDHLGQFTEQVRATATQIAWELGADTPRAGRPFTNGAHGPGRVPTATVPSQIADAPDGNGVTERRARHPLEVGR